MTGWDLRVGRRGLATALVWTAALFGLGPAARAAGRLARSRTGRDRVLARTAAFELRLGGDWRRDPGDGDEDAYDFSSQAKGAQVVISALPAALPRARLLEAAQKLLEFRLKAERSVRDRGLVIDDNRATMQDDGLGHVAYAARDRQGIYRFLGWTTQRWIISLWIATEGHDDKAAKAVFDEVVKGFRFDH